MAFDLHIYIWPLFNMKVKIKSMHNSAKNTLEMVIDGVEVNIAIK